MQFYAFALGARGDKPQATRIHGFGQGSLDIISLKVKHTSIVPPAIAAMCKIFQGCIHTCWMCTYHDLSASMGIAFAPAKHTSVSTACFGHLPATYVSNAAPNKPAPSTDHLDLAATMPQEHCKPRTSYLPGL